MTFREVPGNKLKHGNDVKLLVATKYGEYEAVSNKDVARQVIHIFKNEDRIYPPTAINPNTGMPYLGGQKFLNALLEAIEYGVDAVDWDK